MQTTTQIFQALSTTPQKIRNIGLISQSQSLSKQIFSQWRSRYEAKLESEEYRRYIGCCCDCWDRGESLEEGRKGRVGALVWKGEQMGGKGNQQESYLVNVVRFDQTNFEYQSVSALKIVDSALICISESHPNLPWIQQTTTLILKQHLIPAVYIDIDISPQTNHKTLQKSLSTLIKQITFIIDLAYERISKQTNFKMGKFGVDHFIFGSVGRWWAFSFQQVLQFLYKDGKEGKEGKEMGIEEYPRVFWDGEVYDYEGKVRVKEEEGDKRQKISVVELVCGFLADLFQSKPENTQILRKRLKFSLSPLPEQPAQTQPPTFSPTKLLQTFLPLPQKTLQKLLKICPSPVQSQKYRMNRIYKGAQDDQVALSISACNGKGPVIVYLVGFGVFYEKKVEMYGRVFSGTVGGGGMMKVVDLGGGGEKGEGLVKNVAFSSMVGRKSKSICQIVPGNFVIVQRLVSLKNNPYILTLPNFPIVEHQFCKKSTRVQDCIQTQISPQQPADLPKMIDKIRKTLKTTFSTKYQLSETGAHILKSSSPTSLKNFLQKIQQYLPIKKSQLTPIYKQTIGQSCPHLVVGVSQNRHNRLYGTATPIDEKIMEKIEDLNEESVGDVKQRMDKLGWDEGKDGVIWSFGEDSGKENILVDQFSYNSSSRSYAWEIRDSVTSAFQWATKQGVLCQEHVRGIKYSLVDVELTSDAIHRGGGQIIPTARRIFYGCQLLSKPTLLQPLTKFHFSLPKNSPILSPLSTQLSLKKIPLILLEQQQQSTKLLSSKYVVEVPVVDDLYMWIRGVGVDVEKVETVWREVQGLVSQEGTRGYMLVRGIRERKGLNLDLPPVTNYVDKA